jgi:hypothetical protein
MEPAKIKYIMDTALKTPEIRRACFSSFAEQAE